MFAQANQSGQPILPPLYDACLLVREEELLSVGVWIKEKTEVLQDNHLTKGLCVLLHCTA